MPSISELSTEQQATLALVVMHGRSYDEVGEALNETATTVRERAHSAFCALTAGPRSDSELDETTRGEVNDFLLGALTAADCEVAKIRIARSPAAHRWATAVRAALAKSYPEISLPEISSRPEKAARQTAPSSRLGGAVLLIGVLILATSVTVVLRRGDNGGPAKDESKPAVTTKAARGTKLVGDASLAPTKAGSRAKGVVQVLAQGQRQTLAIVASGLKPATSTSTYAVWLYNSASDTQLLGYVDPPVGTDGQFSNLQGLTAGSSRLRAVVVSKEGPNSKGKRPGQIVLRGSLNWDQ